MMLSPIAPEQLSERLHVLSRGFEGAPLAQLSFKHIAATWCFCPDLKADLFAHHGKAVALAQDLGMATIDEPPAQSFSWDGQAVRTRTETAVLLHEIAHWQIAPPTRRNLPDFGLGAGPETGRVAEANSVRCVDDRVREKEENLASLLGILWEVEIGGPALIAFCEQNWLELHDRPGTAAHFISVFSSLRARGLIDDHGRPRFSNTYPAAA